MPWRKGPRYSAPLGGGVEHAIRGRSGTKARPVDREPDIVDEPALVLRESGHSEHGIMRAQLDVHSTADYFTAEQADVIRSVVMAAGGGTELVNP